MVPYNDSRGPWRRRLCVRDALAARSSSWGLGKSGSARYAPSLAQDPREGPVMSWMPVSAMISSKRLGVQERSGCCTVNTEAPVEGPYEPWAGSAKAGAGPWVGTQWLVVEVRVVAYGARCAPCPPSPFQLPSTSRRRGFKDPWGGCRLSALGSGRSGLWEVGGASCLPRAQPSPEGPGLCGMSGSLPPWLLGGGYPTVIMWAVTVCGACVPPLHVPRGGLEPPLRRLWGVQAFPAPVCETVLIPSGRLCSV